jgi:phosphonate transport system substrate-binding protein
MKKIGLAVLMTGVVGWVGLSVSTSATAETLYFAPLPMEQPEDVVKQFKPMLTYLERQLGVTVEIRYSTSYQEVLDKFEKGEVDFAYLGPLPYVTLRDKFEQAIPVVHFLEKSGKPSYTCAIISAGAPLNNGLKGKKIALTQALSTCGYLSTDGLLHKVNSSLELNKYRYLGKHDAVAEAVASGEFEYGGIKTAIAKNFEHLGVKVLAETAPIPSFALIANGKRLSPSRIEALRSSLARLKPEAADKALMADWGNNVRFGSAEAKDGDFDVVRQLRRRTDIPEKGNF